MDGNDSKNSREKEEEGGEEEEVKKKEEWSKTAFHDHSSIMVMWV